MLRSLIAKGGYSRKARSNRQSRRPTEASSHPLLPTAARRSSPCKNADFYLLIGLRRPTLARVGENPMTPVKEKAVSATTTVIRPGDLRLRATSKPTLHHVSVAEAFTKLHGIKADMQVPMKTFGPREKFIGMMAAGGSPISSTYRSLLSA
jgi:hypothetical protein